MEEINIGLTTLKVVIGFSMLFFIITVTGKVSINELSPYHLVFLLVLGDFLGEALYANEIHIGHFLYASGLWTALMLLIEKISQRFSKTRSFLEGSPAIIIRNGIMDRELMKKNKLDVDEVASLLRLKNIFSVREVQYGILEENGQISVLRKSAYDQPQLRTLQLPQPEVDLPVSFISDGEILLENLKARGFDRSWLINELKKNGYESEKDIFYADWRKDGGLHISPK